MNVRKGHLYLVGGTVALYLALLGVLVHVLHLHGQTLQWFATIGDANEYYTLGQSLLNAHVFSMDGIHHEFFRTPGAPLFIAILLAITGSVWGVVFAQILLVAATAYFIARIGERIFSQSLYFKHVGVIAAVLYVLDPATIYCSFLTISDTLFVFLLVAAVYVLLSDIKNIFYKAALMGALLGYAVLVRPIGEFIVPIFAVWLAVASYPTFRDSKRLALAGVCMMAVAGLFIVPWMARNYTESGHFSLSSIGPYNFLFFNTVEYDVSKGMGTRDSLKQGFLQDLGVQSITDVRDFSYSAKMTALVRQNLEPHMLSYIEFHILKSIPFYIGSSIENTTLALTGAGVMSGPLPATPNISYEILKGNIVQAVHDLAANPFELLERFFWLAVLFFDIAALLYARGMKQLNLVFFALLALAFGALTGPVSMPRYRLPAEPFMLLAALAGLGYTAAFVKEILQKENKHVRLVLEVGKYFLASLVALVVDFGLLYILASLLHVYYLLAAFISFIAGIAVVYVLSIRYVFADRRMQGSAKKEFLIFLAVGAVGLGINELVLWVFTGGFGVHYLLSKLISVVFVFTWNYLARKLLLF